MNEHRLVSEFGWVVSVGDDVSIALRPIVTVLLIAVVPLLIKYYLHRRLKRETAAPWLYPIEVGYMPVSCLACDVFHLPVAASDSPVGQVPIVALVGLLMCFWLWYEALKAAITAGQLPVSTLRTLSLDLAMRLVLVSVLLFGVCSFGRFDLLH